MKLKYSREVDILTVTISEAPVDYAEEAGPLIVHFSPGGQPVLVEIQGGRDFVREAFASYLASEVANAVLGELRKKLEELSRRMETEEARQGITPLSKVLELAGARHP